MSYSQSRLGIFDKISKDKITELCKFFDENMALIEPANSEIRRIIGEDFKDEDIEKIFAAFFSFVTGKNDPKRIFEAIGESQLDDEKKTSLKDVIKKLHAKVDSDKLTPNLQRSKLSTNGNPDVSNNENLKNENAFEDFKRKNLNNPQFKNKFVAIVKGEFQDVGDDKITLVKKMYDKFGNVHMYVDKITDQEEIIRIRTPKFI